MGDVEGLHAVHPERGEAVDRGEHVGGVGDVPEGMRPDREAAGVVDRLQGLGDGGRLAQAKGCSALDQVSANQRADVVDALLAQALVIGLMAEHGVCQMGPPDRLTGC